MEEVSTKVHNGIRGYWRRKKGYHRLTSGGRRRTRVVKLASTAADGSTRRCRFWRIKLKLRFSPKNFFIRLRDAYVNMMMRIANTRMIGGGYGGGGYPGDGIMGFGMRAVKEYDERMIVEIYKSIVMAQGKLVPRDAAWISSEITCNNKLIN